MGRAKKLQKKFPHLQKQKKMSKNTDQIKYLTATKLGQTKKKYCRFKKHGIKYIDYKDPDYLLTFVNEQGKILPRRITGNSLKFQRKIAQAVKRARHLSLMPFVTDLLK
jgi:small subunit ribosomal protein S18